MVGQPHRDKTAAMPPHPARPRERYENKRGWADNHSNTRERIMNHRTICAVILEIQEAAKNDGRHDIIELCEEAFKYARSMSAKLEEYKSKSNKQQQS